MNNCKITAEAWFWSVVICCGLVLAWILGAPLNAQVQILPADQIAAMRATLPTELESAIFEKGELNRILFDDPTTLFYTREAMPPAYQLGSGNKANQPPMMFADPMLNVAKGIAGEGDKVNGQGGNANIDPPWAPQPGGTLRTVNIRDFKAMWLPKQDNGKPYPIVYWPKTMRGMFQPADSMTGWGWIYPVDAVFIEVLLQRYQGVDYVFEIRIRRREYGAWDVDILRPFNSRRDIAAALAKIDSTDPLIDVLSQSGTPPTLTMAVKHEGRNQNTRRDDRTAFEGRAMVDYLPRIEPDKVAVLLATTPFVSALGEDWNPGNETEPFSIVPPKYDGMFAGKDRNECAQCHNAAQTSARSWDLLRAWHGDVRGSTDQILSFVIVDPESYVGSLRGRQLGSTHPAYDTDTAGPNRTAIYLRPSFVAAGMIERFNPSRHTEARYQALAP